MRYLLSIGDKVITQDGVTHTIAKIHYDEAQAENSFFVWDRETLEIEHAAMDPDKHRIIKIIQLDQ